MSSSTTFVLSSVSSADTLPPTLPLHLLPFSLGTSSSPCASTSALISTYFQPRPCPANHPSLTPGTSIAAFRGRQLVGQTVSVPRGYKGVVLGATKRLDAFSSSTVREKGRAGPDVKLPLTPASSTTSVMADAAEEGVRRSPRKSNRGVGQVALSRPKFKRPIPNKKRFRLDSDEEDEDENESENNQKEIAQSRSRSTVARTPSKRTRTDTTTTPIKAVVGDLPSIIVQAATPLKEPISPPRARLPPVRDIDIDANEIEVLVADGNANENEAVATDGEAQVKDEPILPSPATEDDPPTFSIDDSAISASSERDDDTSDAKREGDMSDEAHTRYDGPVRALRPLSTFTEFTLWTPDAPLAGFRQDEDDSNSKSAQETNNEGEQEGQSQREGEGKGEEAGGIQLNKGWWRSGGAGEGGDEFVRGLGEWLGFVEMLNEPVYLYGLSEDPEDDDE
ncbi:ribonuclease H2, subunit C [Naematelia encephala]|uniref:Ribonuclease H2, subunit C n=1 Tax=Naematelia encephala TaxID=71784 RepID=A0A1Y2BBP3_9TREE|nr:ribonuclease H2, subunit C [Naematelia encephala]